MKTAGLVFTALVLGLMSGCGSHTTTQGAQLNTAANPPHTRVDTLYLRGVFHSGCNLDPKRSGIYITEDLQYDIGEVTRLTNSYLDAKCGAALEQVSVTSTYTVSPTGVYTENRKSVSILPQASAAVGMMMMDKGYCADHGWRVNEERTFTDVNRCGIAANAELTLKKRTDRGFSELTARECEPLSPRSCTEMNYIREN